jgi:hypothetical protein
MLFTIHILVLVIHGLLLTIDQPCFHFIPTNAISLPLPIHYNTHTNSNNHPATLLCIYAFKLHYTPFIGTPKTMFQFECGWPWMQAHDSQVPLVALISVTTIESGPPNMACYPFHLTCYLLPIPGYLLPCTRLVQGVILGKQTAWKEKKRQGCHGFQEFDTASIVGPGLKWCWGQLGAGREDVFLLGRNTGNPEAFNVIFKKPIHVETNFDPIAIGEKDVGMAMEVRR